MLKDLLSRPKVHFSSVVSRVSRNIVLNKELAFSSFACPQTLPSYFLGPQANASSRASWSLGHFKAFSLLERVKAGRP